MFPLLETCLIEENVSLRMDGGVINIGGGISVGDGAHGLPYIVVVQHGGAYNWEELFFGEGLEDFLSVWGARNPIDRGGTAVKGFPSSVVKGYDLPFSSALWLTN